jgi:cobaltochelatase CobS
MAATKPQTRAEARRQILRDHARSVGVSFDVNSAKLSELLEVWKAHQGTNEPDALLIDRALLDHAKRNSLDLAGYDLSPSTALGAGGMVYDAAAAGTAAGTASRAVMVDEADAIDVPPVTDEDERILAELFDEDAKPEPSPEEARADEAQALLADLMSHLMTGERAQALSSLTDLLSARDRALQAPAVLSGVTQDAGGEAGEIVPFAVQIPDLKGDKRARRFGMRVYGAPSPLPVEDYIWPAGSVTVLKAAADGWPVFLAGPRGTGKTEFAANVAAAYGRPFYDLGCDDQTDAPTWAGQIVPDGAGGTVWQDGALVKALRDPHGPVILIDEPSMARPGALALLHALMDRRRTLTIADTGERVPMPADAILILADNTAGQGDSSGIYAGTRVMNGATMDRPMVIQMQYLDKAREAKLLRHRYPITKEQAAGLAAFGHATRKAHDAGEMAEPIGTRALLRLAYLLSIETPAAETLAVGLLDRAPDQDKVAISQHWQAQFFKNNPDAKKEELL